MSGQATASRLTAGRSGWQAPPSPPPACPCPSHHDPTRLVADPLAFPSTRLAPAALTAIPASLGARQPAAPILQAQTA